MQCCRQTARGLKAAGCSTWEGHHKRCCFTVFCAFHPPRIPDAAGEKLLGLICSCAHNGCTKLLMGSCSLLVAGASPSVAPPGPQSQGLVLPDPSFQGGSQLKLRSQQLLPDQNRAWCEEEQRPLPPVFQSSEISFSKSSAVPFLRALAPLLLGLCESEKGREYRVCMVWNGLHRFSLDKIPPISLMTWI